jgi:hypothetical protein
MRISFLVGKTRHVWDGADPETRSLTVEEVSTSPGLSRYNFDNAIQPAPIVMAFLGRNLG